MRHQAVRLELERNRHQVEHVADRVEPGDLDDLLLAGVFAQRLEDGIGDAAAQRRRFGVGEHRALALREERTRPEIRERLELVEHRRRWRVQVTQRERE